MTERLIAIAGPSGAGKSLFARRINESLKLAMDDYFVDFGRPDYFLDPIWDTPAAYDLHTIRTHVDLLKRGEPVEVPRFDFVRGRRSGAETTKCDGLRALVVEGLYAFEVVPAHATRVFLDARYEDMVHRCLPRDRDERGRSVEADLLRMYRESWTKYERFLFPQRRRADFVLPSDWPIHISDQIGADEIELRLEQWRQPRSA